MIPYLSLGSLEPTSSLKNPKLYPSNSTIPSSFLLECLRNSEICGYGGNASDISILSADCLNSQDSVMRNRINILYQDAARTVINISNKLFKHQSLALWKSKIKRKQTDTELKKLATGIVRLSYFINKKVRCMYLPAFINIQSLMKSRKGKRKGVERLVEVVGIVEGKYYRYGRLRDGMDSIIKESKKRGSLKDKGRVLESLIKSSVNRSCSTFMQIIKEETMKFQKLELFVESIAYVIKKSHQQSLQQSFKTIFANKDLLKSNEISAKSSTIQSSNKLTLSSAIISNQFKRSTDSLPKYFDSPILLTKSSHNNNFVSEAKSRYRTDVEQPEEAETVKSISKGKFSHSKLTKGDLCFSSPKKRQKSKQKPSMPQIPLLNLAPYPKISRTLMMNYSFHRELNVESIQILRPIEGKFVNQTRTCPMYHIQPDTVYTQVEDLINNPQIFQQECSPKPTFNSRATNRFQTRSSVSRSGKKSLQFKSKIGSPIHFKQILSPKLFPQKSRQNSSDKPKLGFRRPTTPKKPLKPIPSSQKYQVFGVNRNPQSASTRKQLYKIRVQGPFVEQKSTSKKDLIFDSNAYFKE